MSGTGPTDADGSAVAPGVVPTPSSAVPTAGSDIHGVPHPGPGPAEEKKKIDDVDDAQSRGLKRGKKRFVPDLSAHRKKRIKINEYTDYISNPRTRAVAASTLKKTIKKKIGRMCARCGYRSLAVFVGPTNRPEIHCWGDWHLTEERYKQLRNAITACLAPEGEQHLNYLPIHETVMPSYDAAYPTAGSAGMPSALPGTSASGAPPIIVPFIPTGGAATSAPHGAGGPPRAYPL